MMFLPEVVGQAEEEYDLESRRARYFRLSSELALIDNTQMSSLLGAAERQPGWGANNVIDVAGSKVFVKRIPATDLEVDNMFSTKNLYDLPTYYNYGVGSAGFGVFRELVANIKTTNWVLEGAIANFPLLYHYRMMPFRAVHPNIDMERHRRYVEHWNSNENTGRYILDRANATYELVLFIEHMPYSLSSWLLENPTDISTVLEDLRETVAFLRKNGIVHFDAHFDNVLSDGEHAYLTDFGLVLDQRFDLSEEESLFLEQHTHYDYGVVIGSLGFQLFGVYRSLSDDDKRKVTETYGIADEASWDDVVPILVNNLEALRADEAMKLDDSYVATIVKYRSIILLFLDFLVNMTKNPQKDTPFPHDRLSGLLNETGFLSDVG